MVRSRGEFPQRQAASGRTLHAGGPDHINYEVTVEDPAVFSRPWKMSMPFYRRKERNVQLLEYDPGLLIDEAQAEQERRQRD